MADNDKQDEADILSEARKAYERCEEAEGENRRQGEESIRFSRLGEQWPEALRAQRETEGRPVLTINKLPAFIRQVVNDARQNKPAIRVSPVDDGADKETAKVLSGLIRNIEHQSSADVAYDTALENAVQYWVGYVGVDIDYAHDNSFDLECRIRRFINPASVYGDPDSTSADGSDWNVCFVIEDFTKDEFKRKYGDKAQKSWDHSDWNSVQSPWKTEETVQIAEWWTREVVEREIMLCAVPNEDGTFERVVYDRDELESNDDLAPVRELIEQGIIEVIKTRTVESRKVRQRIISGIEVLEDNEWPGKYIPIVPVYGDEFNIEGKRYIRSLIWDAMDAQRMFNYWRTTATELVALAPRVPFIGPEGFAKPDEEGWATANTVSHAYLEYAKDAIAPPQRQPLDTGAAAGALQEALNASDDMKAILGIYDASLGARSNETSGRAIMARQREGDVSTFHFIDNLARSIRQVGRILIDLIPHVYSERQMVRILGEDGSEEEVPLGVDREIEQPNGNVTTVKHDLTVGKYDVAVSTGPSFTTKREENAYNMTEFVRAVPQMGAIMLDKIASSQDWEGAEEIAERAKAMMPKPQETLPPEIQQGLAQGQQAMQELEALRTDKSIEAAKIEIEQYKAETDRWKVLVDADKAGADIEMKAAQMAEKTASHQPERSDA